MSWPGRFPILGEAGWALAVLGLLGGLFVACLLFLPPVERLQGTFTQTPWMVVESVQGQGSPVPFADQDDPRSLYLVFTMGMAGPSGSGSTRGRSRPFPTTTRGGSRRGSHRTTWGAPTCST